MYYFGEIKDGKMILSQVGIIANILWHEIKHHAKNIELGEFVVMPNHIHGISILNNYNDTNNTNVETRHALSLHSTERYTEPFINKTIGQQRFQNQGKNSVSAIIGSYKSAITKHAHLLNFDFAWQTRFYDNIIKNEAGHINKLNNTL